MKTKLFTLLLAVVASVGTIFAGTNTKNVTIDYSTMNYTNQTNLNEVSVSIGDISVTLSKGTGTVEPKYYELGTGARTYAGNTITISAGSFFIYEIVFTFSQNNKNYSVNNGTYSKSEATWTGYASNVIFTTEDVSGHNRIQAISVKYFYQESNCSQIGIVNTAVINGNNVADVICEFCYPQAENQQNYNYIFLPGDDGLVNGYTVCGLEQLSQTWSGTFNHRFKYYLIPSSQYTNVEYVCSNQEYNVGDQIDGKTIVGRSVRFYKGFTTSASSIGCQYDELFFFKEGCEIVHITSSLRYTVSDIYPHYDEFRPTGAYDYMYATINPISVTAKMPQDWTNTISAWVWEDEVEGHWVTLDKNGEWYSYTSTANPLNIVFVNGIDWNGNDNQTIDIRLTESACIQIGTNINKRDYSYVDCPDEESDPYNLVYLPYYEPFTYSIGAFNILNIDLGGLGYVWQWASADYGMKSSAYVSGNNNATESWLVSPPISLLNASHATLAFEHAVNKGTTSNLKVLITTDPTGETWDELTISNWPTDANWTFVSASTSLDQYVGNIAQIAFVYVSTTSDCPTWEIKNLSVTGNEVITQLPSTDVDASQFTKILRNGQIYILRGEKVYTLQGQEIK